MQRFIEQTLTSDYIKALLKTTPLPKYKSVSDGDYIVSGIKYIYNNNIIKCTSNGYIGITNGAGFSYVSEYTFGEDVLKLTNIFRSTYNYYDSKTHERLGNYLRLYRDTYGIDLMPFYNCYSNEQTSYFYISNYGTILQQTDSKFKVLSIPIKFNTTYTIAIDCDATIKTAPAFICNGDYLFVGESNITENFEKLLNQSKTYPSTKFLSPFTTSITNTLKTYEQFERYLRLFIQIPYNCTSSIVVLEGDYTNCSTYKTINMLNDNNEPTLDQKTQTEINKLFIYKLQLLKMNDKVSYPFSDRLVEYLFDNVITNADDVENDVKRVQEAIGIDKYNFKYLADVWDINLRKLLFDKYVHANPNSYDINGFVDKNIEKYLNGVQLNGN